MKIYFNKQAHKDGLEELKCSVYGKFITKFT
jgi:hypothetical protein